MKTKVASRLEGLLLSHFILVSPLDLGSSAASLVVESGSSCNYLPTLIHTVAVVGYRTHTPLASQGHHSSVQVRDIGFIEFDRRRALET